MIKDDYEYALWFPGRHQSFGEGDVASGGICRRFLTRRPPTLSTAGWQIRTINTMIRDVPRRWPPASSFADKYAGKAISLYGKAIVFRGRFDSLSRISRLYAGQRSSDAELVGSVL